MADIAYLSTLCPRLSLDQQDAIHAAHTPGWPAAPTYRDELPPAARMAHAPAALVGRARMLRALTLGGVDVLHVASLATLAVSAADFVAVAAALADAGAWVHAHDTGRLLAPTARAPQLHAALADFLDGKRRSAVAGQGSRPATEASTAARNADARRRADLIAQDWHESPAVPTQLLLLRAGRKVKGRRDVVPMAYSTAAGLLGKRPRARRAAVQP